MDMRLNNLTVCACRNYDSASVMSEKHAGLQSKCKEVCSKAVYLNCFAYYLTFVLADYVQRAIEFFVLIQIVRVSIYVLRHLFYVYPMSTPTGCAGDHGAIVHMIYRDNFLQFVCDMKSRVHFYKIHGIL